MEQSKIIKYVNDADKNLSEFIKQNPLANKFSRPDFNDSAAQERMMRVGVEARFLAAKSEDEIYMLAVATLQNDHVKYERIRLTLLHGSN